MTISSKIRGIALAVCTATVLSLMIAPFSAQAASTFSIKLNSNGKCLGISGGSTAEGTPAILYSCNGHPDQQWHYGNYASYNGLIYYQIVNGHNQCLGVHAGSTSPAARLVQWPCLNATHEDQYWSAPVYTNCGSSHIIFNYAATAYKNVNVITDSVDNILNSPPFAGEYSCATQAWDLPDEP